MKFTAIKENHLYVKAYTGGKHASGRTCSVYVLRDRQAARIAKARPDKKQINRIGITASKKIGGAVQRNRAKRVLRAGLREIMTETPLKTGRLIVLAAKVGATQCKTQDVVRDLRYQLKKLELFEEREETPAAQKP